MKLASPEKIRSFYESGFSFPLIWKRRAGLSPWEFYERVYSKSSRSFFFDSSGGRPPAQHYSYLGWEPYLEVSFKGGKLFRDGSAGERADLLSELRRLFRPVKLPPGIRFDFFTGGAAGYWGYELAREFERVRFRRKKPTPLPDLVLLFFRDLAVFDHQDDCYYLISWLFPKKGVSFKTALGRAEAKLHEMESWFFFAPESYNGHFDFARFRPEISQADFEKMVLAAKKYIRAGDIYQANLSQRFSFTFEGSPLRLYERLRKTNPAPFSAVFHWGELFIASSSPELLVAKKGRKCVTCPIAGTRPRGRSQGERQRLLRELRTNEKERAEHLMLVDLERNDLGRVSEWRSVEVKDFMRLEKYARVIHLVSEIQSRLRPSKDAFDVIQAMFPGGTITGCPKIRSMEIIDELEPAERGVYTGSIGYVGFDGDLMLNIAIRTLILSGRQGYLQVGAGIVADSDPGREYEETLHKGEALVEALISASPE